jgi:hypothetical protein
MSFEMHMQNSRSQWPCGLSRGSAAARLLGLWVRIPPGAWMFVLYKDSSMKDKKGLHSTKNGSKGKTPGINTKKIPTDGFLRVT